MCVIYTIIQISHFVFLKRESRNIFIGKILFGIRNKFKNWYKLNFERVSFKSSIILIDDLIFDRLYGVLMFKKFTTTLSYIKANRLYRFLPLNPWYEEHMEC